jgi:ArsR family transcriptional regulator
MNLMQGLKAIASPTRLKILHLLGDPRALGKDYVTLGNIRGATATALCKRVGVTQPSLSAQMQILLNTGLIEAHPSGRFVIYARDEERIRQFKQTVIDQLLPPT